MKSQRILIPGGAGQVGQNLILRLKAKGYSNLVVLDKHVHNLGVLKSIHPDIRTIEVDLSQPGEWQNEFKGADAVVMLQAQIGSLNYADFDMNTVRSTKLVLEAMLKHGSSYLVHVSSSVVASSVENFYNRSKIAQEEMILASGIKCPILRPTLMFGWFDRKHLGWLSRFIQKTPVIPIPGDGRYERRPLFVGDFCEIIISCIEKRSPVGIFNIFGQQKIDYIDMVRMIKKSTSSRAIVVCIPYSLFYALLWMWSCINKNPPFTTQQLEYLVAKYHYEVIDWQTIFGVTGTPFQEALNETYRDTKYSRVALEF